DRHSAARGDDRIEIRASRVAFTEVTLSHAQAGYTRGNNCSFPKFSPTLRPEEEGLQLVAVVVARYGDRAAQVIAKDVPLQRLLESSGAGCADRPVEEKIVGIHRVISDKLVSCAVKSFRSTLCRDLD